MISETDLSWILNGVRTVVPFQFAEFQLAEDPHPDPKPDPDPNPNPTPNPNPNLN